MMTRRMIKGIIIFARFIFLLLQDMFDSYIHSGWVSIHNPEAAGPSQNPGFSTP
jgi:hypothetical protein